ncbi:MAG: 4-(cytidine 5'-diphospho)-2-C-methyl-D-erythritol kinase [Candidatus Zixiibacteriota bacterium]|nr:MAG: 4-(cytidine 5'-diphospho)-2-C-methyl-D-erythritol kinase [candidate division Zixibacteria bacterium]
MFVSQISPNRVKIEAPAKINLFLEVLEKRSDGYHNINSLFQAVSLFDVLEFELTDKQELTLDILGDQRLKSDESNLVCQAFQLMWDTFGLKKAPAIKLNKRIPIAAGLAGGSSDAAATIMACNLLYKLKLSYSEMAELGLQIGSDIPFFFSGGQALISGRGEKVLETSFPCDYKLLLITPNLHVSTEKAYGLFRMDLTNLRSPFILRRCETVIEFIECLSLSGNDFERAHFELFPELGRVRNVLLRMGASLVRMSGSGPTIFGIFKEIPESEKDQATHLENWRCYTVEPITLLRRDDIFLGRPRGDY